MRSCRSILTGLAAISGALALASPAGAEPQEGWAYFGASRTSLGAQIVIAAVSGAGRERLRIECRSPDGMLPARIVFGLDTNIPYHRETHGSADVTLVISTSEGDYSLTGAARRRFPTGELEAHTQPQFGDSSLAAVRAMRAASGPVGVTVSGATMTFPIEGVAAAIDQLLADCGVRAG